MQRPGHYNRRALIEMGRRGGGAWWLGLAMVAATVVVASGDFASDRAECADQLVGLATCLTYVEGSAAMATPDCCSGLKQVLGKSPKCLCVLIKDRNEPGLGLKINATRALSLPDVCDAQANITDCPRLLNLPKGSKDAEIFEQFGNATTKHGKGNAQSIEEGSSSFHSNGVGRSYYLKGQGLLEVQLPLLLLLSLPLVLFGS